MRCIISNGNQREREREREEREREGESRRERERGREGVAQGLTTSCDDVGSSDIFMSSLARH